MPGLKLACDGFNLFGLFHRVDADLACELTGDMRQGDLADGPGGVLVDAFTEFLQHLDGGADLRWGRGGA